MCATRETAVAALSERRKFLAHRAILVAARKLKGYSLV
jgi:hypothetical protein